MKQKKGRHISLCEDKVQHNGQSVRIKQENITLIWVFPKTFKINQTSDDLHAAPVNNTG